MNTFKRKSLYAALAGVSALGATTAGAVNVNPDGLGQVLLYPYYTVRGGQNTVMSVVNTTSSVKIVKVRFKEGKNSREVLDFNLYLSPNDVWTAALLDNGTGAKIVTSDNSCTNPDIRGVSAGIAFRNSAYAADPAGGSLDRTREGYFEVIEIGNLTNGTLANAAIHNSAGVPANCALIRAKDGTLGAEAVIAGGLFGSEAIINVAAGTDYSADPVALDNWKTVGTVVTPTAPTSTTPSLADALPTTSDVFLSNTVAVVHSVWNNGTDAVSAALMHDAVYNEYVVDTGLAAGTDWVVTFPTKFLYYTGSVVNNQIAVASFNSGNTSGEVGLFQRNFTSSGACDDVTLDIFDREEQFPSSPSNFSPSPTSENLICWEANVVTFNNSGVLKSVNSNNVDVSPYPAGWMKLGLPYTTPANSPFGATSGAVNTTAHLLVSQGGAFETGSIEHSYIGLPVIGFAAQSYTNNSVASGVLANYGASFIHKYSRNVQ